MSKPPRSQAKQTAVAVKQLKREKNNLNECLGAFLLIHPLCERTDGKIALCVRGGGQAEDVALFRASVSPAARFAFPQSCLPAPCNGSAGWAPPTSTPMHPQRGQPQGGAAFHRGTRIQPQIVIKTAIRRGDSEDLQWQVGGSSASRASSAGRSQVGEGWLRPLHIGLGWGGHPGSTPHPDRGHGAMGTAGAADPEGNGV